MEFGIQETQMSALLDILMLTWPSALMIGKALPVVVSTLEITQSWMSKKQNSVSLSTVEAEYIAVASCCAQLLWMKKLLHDYGITQDTICVFCDNTSAINLSKNPVQHSKSKHIEIRYHFIRDLVEEKTVYLEFINIDKGRHFY